MAAAVAALFRSQIVGVEITKLRPKSRRALPEMDGIECVEHVIKIKPDVLILVVSALADKATAVEAIEKGANGFLCKPFTDDQLNEALAELIGE